MPRNGNLDLRFLRRSFVASLVSNVKSRTLLEAFHSKAHPRTDNRRILRSGERNVPSLVGYGVGRSGIDHRGSYAAMS